MADHTKIGAVGRYRSIPFSEIETSVTDQPVEELFVRLLTGEPAPACSIPKRVNDNAGPAGTTIEEKVE